MVGRTPSTLPGFAWRARTPPRRHACIHAQVIERLPRDVFDLTLIFLDEDGHPQG
jgi:hypothetical protein